MDGYYSIPKNYQVVTANGLQGIVKVAKDGSEKIVMECVTTVCAPAKSYGRIFMAFMLVGETSLRLCNYNGSVFCELPVLDVRFGARSLYIKTVKPDSNEISWCLIDKDLKPVRFVGNFEILDRYCREGFYIPVGQEYIEVVREDGKRYYLELTTGNMDEVKVPTMSKKEVEKEIAPTKYDLYFDIETGYIRAIADTGKEMNVNKFPTIWDARKLIASLLNAEIELLNMVDAKGINNESRYDYRIKGIEAERAEKFMAIMKKIENMGDISVLPLLIRYIREKAKGNHLDILDELNAELTNGFYKALQEKDGAYSIKCYVIGDYVLTLVKNKNDRIVSIVHPLENSRVFDEIDIQQIKDSYNKSGIQGSELVIMKADVSTLICNESQTSRFPKPYSIIKRKDFNNSIKSHYYERLHRVSLECRLDNDISISFEVVILDGFCYIPKAKRNTKTIVDKGRTNNILVMLG